MSKFEQRKSGLVVPREKPADPPEHPLRPMIREALAALAEKMNFTMTTHGCLGPHNIASVASSLIAAYENPTPYSISNLYQHAQGLCKDAATDGD